MKLILKGLGVSKGKAKGNVKIVETMEDHKDFKQGDILVTRITDPTMTKIMGKAAAIVCEIGGLTSHPSIISRELGIPCIVSVKDATKILKQGDLVHVCGEKGEIHVAETSIFTGQCTCPGIVEGKIRRYQKGKTYKKEDIVIINEFVTQNLLLLRDAGAILSSTGGITCHAAIIARELNIPCMVSVKGIENLEEGTEVIVDTASEVIKVK